MRADDSLNKQRSAVERVDMGVILFIDVAKF